MNTVHPEPAHQLGSIEHIVLAMRIAAEESRAHIESNAVVVDLAGQRWYDTRPMLDEREQPLECLDINAVRIAYALDAHIAIPHPEQPHLLRIVHVPAAHQLPRD
jgi:hypothetical protein